MNTKRTHYVGQLSPETSSEDVVICGWMHEYRDLGGIQFLLLRDRTGIVQVTMVKKYTEAELWEKARHISRESVLAVRGKVQAEKKAPGGFEVIPAEIDVLSAADTPLPMDPTGKVGSEIDTRLDSRYMDLRRPWTTAVFKVRSTVLGASREFLSGKGFIEITTPKIVATATEGGTALFPISYFEREAFLNQSPQLFKQICMSGGLDRVFEIGPIFRAEEHSTRRHLNEATSIDVEASFFTAEDVMRVLELLVEHCYRRVGEKHAPELETLGVDLQVPEVPFRRLKYDEAIEMARAGEECADLAWGEDLPTAAEKEIGRQVGAHYFITHWPAEIKPFYARPDPDNPKVTQAFDLMHPEMELASGAQREHDYGALRQHIADRGLNPDGFGFYTDPFRFGMPPHAGWGLGGDRLVQTMLKLDNIREVVMFPRDRNRVSP